MTQVLKLVVFVPENYAPKIRETIAKAGAGKLGNYSHCSFSIKGIGRFKPLKGAKPTIGRINKLEQVKEERIETIVLKKDLKKVIKAIKKNHPYEEPAFDVYPLYSIT